MEQSQEIKGMGRIRGKDSTLVNMSCRQEKYLRPRYQTTVGGHSNRVPALQCRTALKQKWITMASALQANIYQKS